MIPTFPEFCKLSVDHKEAIETYTRIFPPYSDYTFPSLLSWNIHEQIELSALHGNLVVRFTDYVTNEKFLSFLGNKEVNRTVEALFALIENLPDHLGYLKLIPQHNLQGTLLGNGFEVAEDPDNHDYVYRVSDLANLNGNKYEKHRNMISLLLRKHACVAVVMDLSCNQVWRDIETLCQTWMRKKLQKSNNVFNDTSALIRLAPLAVHTKLLCVGISVNEKLAAYNILEFNHAGYATSLFEHADTIYPGIYSHLRKQAAVRLGDSGCEWLNNQQDLGITGLRRSKRSYRPASFLKKFVIRRAGKSLSDT